jgi:hypothetical protein
MALGARILQVNLQMPSGMVTLDQTLDLRVRARKDALAIQSTCEITVADLSQNLREFLLSHFSAWNKRQYEQGQATVPYIPVTVVAGYASTSSNGTQQNTTTIFSGQVALCSPEGSLPNLATKITCYTQQLSKVNWITPNTFPASTTFKNYVTLAAQAMGLQLNCQTSHDDDTITNPGASIYNVGSLLIDIQGYYRPNVVAYVDNGTLFVRDASALITTANTVTISEFVNTPQWDEWGAEFETLFNPQLVLSCGAQLQSVLNPSLNDFAYVVYSLEYDLTSRDTPFYVKACGSPAA